MESSQDLRPGIDTELLNFQAVTCGSLEPALCPKFQRIVRTIQPLSVPCALSHYI